jgi:hypothetical protein
MISSVMVGVLPKALHLFRERYPQVNWRLHEMTPAAQVKALKENVSTPACSASVMTIRCCVTSC